MIQFNHYASLYLEFKEHELKLSTFDKYQGIVKSRFEAFNDLPINEIKPSDVKRWLYSINDVGNKSKRHYLGVLSGIFQEALFDEVIEKNPCKIIKLPKYDTPKINPFTSDEVSLIMSSCEENNFKYYVAIAFYTGMRSGEIIGLKKTDIDFKNKLINVQRSRNYYGETTPKTKYSIRQIPVLDLLMPYLVELYSKNDHEYLFVTYQNKPYIDTHVFVNDYWRPLLISLNMPYRRPYNTRHTFASNMLHNNLVTPVQLAQLLGHANTEMVYNVYVNYLEENYKDFDRSISIYR
jgi:integrase